MTPFHRTALALTCRASPGWRVPQSLLSACRVAGSSVCPPLASRGDVTTSMGG